MPKALEWDKTGERDIETGISKTVLYPMTSGNYNAGVAWNGVTGITESPDGAEPNDFYADNIKYASMRSAETFGATVEAFTYPDEWELCDGSAEPASGVFVGQQNRTPFGLCYRTEVKNDTHSENDDGYKLHFIYNATASPSERAYETINDSPDAMTMSWELDTTPISIDGHPELKKTAHIIIHSKKADAAKLAALERILYGTDGEDAVETTYKAAPSTYDPSLRYFTRTGEGTELSPYVYTEVTISEYESGVEYFVIDVEGHAAIPAADARLPLPGELISLMA